MDEKKGMRKVMIYLQNFGISTALAAKIYQKYGSKVYEILETNPYKLADDIEGVGFKTADEIAYRLGFPDPKRDFLCASAVHDRRTCIFAEECFRGKDLQASWC